jgi:hypothetical protein
MPNNSSTPWLKRSNAPAARRFPQIAAAHARTRQIYGAPRIVVELNAESTLISKRLCARPMKAQGKAAKSIGDDLARPTAAMRMRCRKNFSPRIRRRVGPTTLG